MKTETKIVKGKAYLVGNDQKATEALIDGILAMTSADKKAAVKTKLVHLLVQDFEVSTEVQVPETLEEAAGMLANGMDTITKQAIQKAVTNQYDKVRSAKAKEVAEASNVPQLLGQAIAAGK